MCPGRLSHALPSLFVCLCVCACVHICVDVRGPLVSVSSHSTMAVLGTGLRLSVSPAAFTCWGISPCLSLNLEAMLQLASFASEPQESSSLDFLKPRIRGMRTTASPPTDPASCPAVIAVPGSMAKPGMWSHASFPSVTAPFHSPALLPCSLQPASGP